MKRSAFTLVEMLMVIAIMAILIAILIPAIESVREDVRRAKCRSQLRGFGTALAAYAGEGNWKDRWPDCGRKVPTNLSSEIDTKGSLWLLVERGMVPPENFVCPSEEVAGVAAPFKGSVADAADPFPKDDRDRISISYSYQVPHSTGSSLASAITHNPGRNHANATRLAVLADRSPFDYPTGTTPVPLPATLSKLGTWAVAYAALNASSRPKSIDDYVAKKWTLDERNTVNSPNHGGVGQNILYRDGHTEWRKCPLAGINYDNIYTRANGTAISNRAVGTKASDTEIGYDDDDSLLRTFPRP